jgi:hypothetical protein
VYFSLSIVKSGTGLGGVTSVPQGIDCGADCTASYLGGVFVTLTALAEASSTFAGWEPASCGSSFALTADSTCTAAFTKKSYDVMAIAGAGGSITPSARIVNHGDTTTFAVAPDQGYTANASGCGGSLAGTTYTTGAIVEACTVRATFVANDTDSDADGLPTASTRTTPAMRRWTPTATG